MQGYDGTASAPVQITFHYTNGHSDSFLIHDLVGGTRQDLRQEIRRFLNEDWWVIKLAEETIFINPANVLKVELKPPIDLEGEGVLSNGERLTALTRLGR